MSAALLFPLGRCVGSYAAGDFRVQQVLIGTQIVELSDPEFATWSLAHGFPEQVAGRTWARGDVVGALSGSSLVDDPGRLVDRLIARGLLAEVVPGTEDARSFAAAHRLRPLLLGLGNSAEDPDVFAVGFHGRPIAAMTRGLYDVWVWAHLAGDLWSACAEAVLAVRPGTNGSGDVDLQGGRTRLRADTDATLSTVLPALHSLLAPSAACLEVLDPPTTMRTAS